MPRRRVLAGAMTLEEWIAETEAQRPERALWPSETDARRFRDVWCTGRERLESNAWNDEDAVAFWWLSDTVVVFAGCRYTGARDVEIGGTRSTSASDALEAGVRIRF